MAAGLNTPNQQQNNNNNIKNIIYYQKKMRHSLISSTVWQTLRIIDKYTY